MPTGSSRGQNNTNCEKRPQAPQTPNSHAAAAQVSSQQWSKLTWMGSKLLVLGISNYYSKNQLWVGNPNQDTLLNCEKRPQALKDQTPTLLLLKLVHTGQS